MRRDSAMLSWGSMFVIVLLLPALWWARLHGYLLFHSMAEGFTIVVGCGIFMVAWNARRFLPSSYLPWIGAGFLASAVLHGLHTLAYRGMGVFTDSTNVPTQLWIAAQYIEALSLFIGAFLLRRKINPYGIVVGFSAVTVLLFLSIFWWDVFPTCYDETAKRLTPFKVISEYVISALLLASILPLWRRGGEQLGASTVRQLSAAIGVTIVSELAFTLYSRTDGVINFVGHYLGIVSAYLIYRTLIEAALTRPYDVIFRELKLSEDRFRILSEATFEGIVLTESGIITDANDQLTKLCGRAKKELIGRPMVEFIHPDDQARARDILVNDQDSVAEMRICRKDGAVLIVEAHGRPYSHEGLPARITAVRDITRRKETENALRELNEELERRVSERTAVAEQRAEQLRQLASDLTQAEQRERRRLAHVLHDHLQQLLVAAQMNLTVHSRQNPALTRPETLTTVNELLKQAVEASRSLTVELSPPVLSEGGLVAALEWLARRMQEKNHLAVEVAANCPTEPKEEIRVLLFEAARELLFNVAKYAGVQEACVTVDSPAAGTLRLTVEDQGKGFDPAVVRQSAATSGGFGLFSIRQRLEIVGGRIEINSAPGQGACVTIEVPLD